MVKEGEGEGGGGRCSDLLPAVLGRMERFIRVIISLLPLERYRALSDNKCGKVYVVV